MPGNMGNDRTPAEAVSLLGKPGSWSLRAELVAVTPTPVTALLETGRDLAKGCAEIGADCPHHHNRGNGN